MENGSSTSEVEDEEGFVDKDSTGNSLEGGKKRDNTIEVKRRMGERKRSVGSQDTAVKKRSVF